MIKKILLSSVFAISLMACAQETPSEATPTNATSAQKEKVQSEEVTFTASDKEKGEVFGDLFISSGGKKAPLIILFHQAGSNARGEYKNITPKLVAKGYSVLQIDQRSGGGRFGSENRTIIERGKGSKYCEAYADMEGALAYAKKEKFKGPLFAWGSSYSAALTLKLASEHGDDITAALAFSPASGNGMGECAANNFISDVDIPLLGLRPRSEMKLKNQMQMKLFKKQGLEFFVSEQGVHGSSMLDPKRAKGDTTETWDAIWAFLDAQKE